MRRISRTLTSAIALVVLILYVTTKLTAAEPVTTAKPVLPPGFVDLIIYDVPESTVTVGKGINDRRQVVGYYLSPITEDIRQGSVPEHGGKRDIRQGFIREPDEGIIRFPIPTPCPPFCGPLQPAVANNFGDLAGSFETDPEADDPDHGFIVYADGSFITFDVPKSIRTYPDGINALGQVSGFFDDSSGSHGFIRNPGFAGCDVPGSAAQTRSGALTTKDDDKDKDGTGSV